MTEMSLKEFQQAGGRARWADVPPEQRTEIMRKVRAAAPKRRRKRKRRKA